MSVLFEASTINSLKLSNRFVRSATWEGLAAEDGTCTKQLIEYMAQLARGKVGLIISGHAYVRRDGQAGPRQLGVYADRQIEGLKQMTDAVHAEGGKIMMQLAHAGDEAAAALSGLEPVGPSPFKGMSGQTAREMSLEDIRDIIRSFEDAARRALESGFDGIQIHAAHGYFLNQFLSPFYNTRRDAYGGSIENRARLVMEVYRSIRTLVGERYPVIVKLNSQDFLDDGFCFDDMIRVAEMLETEGVDAVEMSGGTTRSGDLRFSRPGRLQPENEVYYRDEAARFKERINVPLILVGGIRSFEVAEKLVEEKTANYIAMSRPLICEPDLIRRWESGDTRPAECLSDNLCYGPTREGRGVSCVMKEKLSRK